MGILIQSQPRRATWLGILTGVILLALSCSSLAAPSGNRRRAAPERLKAVFIHNFATTTKWPVNAFAEDKAPFTVGLLESKALEAPLLEAFNGLKIHGHAVEVRLLKSLDEARTCHLVFVSRREPSALKAACVAVAGRPVLLVTEQPGALAAGSVLNLWQTADDAIRFEFNQASMKRAGVEVSPDVIELAQPNPQTGGAQ